MGKTTHKQYSKEDKHDVYLNGGMVRVGDGNF